MVSQVLFAEQFEIIEEQEEWSHIKMFETGYEGWIQKGQYALANEIENAAPMARQAFIVDLGGAIAQSPIRRVQLLPGTRIDVNDNTFSAEEWFEIEGKMRMPTLKDFDTEFPKLIDYYKDSPYLWGGRSRYGIDCSGLSQAIYRHFGLVLPRDAYQQAEIGQVVDFLTEIQPGDLAFFDNSEGRITHVGIMVDSEHILHASARVRVDKMDSEGIFNSELNRYTHKLRIVKRYFI
ncbi:NlpC/P60 family protein [Sphingobacterium wenxiniae]|uniref:NlpC/P60 family protein n=2 Tax=Sphingobacterium wenxiniae TaxID=683125 RepID=A0A1I6QNG1_9SPHI|nr:NlpC/P60 family protein [Sphingobacterium wenxiniae]